LNSNGVCFYTRSLKVVAAVRYGIIGCGMMGQEHLRNIALLPDAAASCIFEPDDTMAALSLSQAPGAIRCSSAVEVLLNPGVNCILIVSPNFCHAQQLHDIAAARQLPVLMEKPACTSLDDVRSLAALSKTYAAPIWVAMEYRYMPPVTRLLEEVHGAQNIGPMRMLSIR
jgi:myo-inositol 2-dehydrogenase/D-chiro-inositol 1-dehydrogenase